MIWIGRLFPTVMVLTMVASSACAEELIFDFEKGLPNEWKLSTSYGNSTPNAEIEQNGNKTVLELGKNAIMTMGDEHVLNFSIEATVRREYDTSGANVGFQFRNGYRVFMRKPGRLELLGPKQARGRGFSRNRVTHKPLRLKIVVVGPTVRFFINGEFEGQFDELEMQPGPIAFYQKGLQHNCYFDDVKLNTEPDLAQFLTVEPVTGEDEALAFDPGKDVSLKFRLHNHAGAAQRAQLGLEVASFEGKVLAKKTMQPEAIPGG
jgi:hypothetical protein